jgi:hypothetical protein
MVYVFDSSSVNVNEEVKAVIHQFLKLQPSVDKLDPDLLTNLIKHLNLSKDSK